MSYLRNSTQLSAWLDAVISFLTGASTSAKQDTTNGYLATMDVDTGAIATSTASIDGKIETKTLATQVAGTDEAMIVHSVIHGKTTAGGGAYVDVKVNPSGNLTVELNGDSETAINALPLSNMSPFGVLETAELTPSVQGDFVYGLNSQMWVATSSGTGAAVDTNAGRARLQSGTDNGGYAYLQSRRTIRYRAGQGTVVRFTPVFTTGIADNEQFWGVGTVASNAIYDGYGFGYNGAAFGLVRYRAGSPNWVPQASWNGDTCDGNGASGLNWNPTYGVPVMIKYPYLGYGDIEFFVENAATGRWVLCHTIRYSNTTATTQLANPSLRILGFTKNSAATAGVATYCGSVGAFVSGVRSFTGNPKWAWDASKAGVTTENDILSIRSATTYNGMANRGLIRLQSLSASGYSNTAGLVTIRFKINASVTSFGTPAAISGTTADGGVTITSGNSVASYETAGTTISGGTYVYNTNFSVGQNGSGGAFIDLIPYEIYIAPAEVLTVTGAATSSTTIGVSLNWSEDI